MKKKVKKRELNFFIHAQNVMGKERFYKAVRRSQSRGHELLHQTNDSLVLSENDFVKVETELEKSSMTCSRLDRAHKAHK